MGLANLAMLLGLVALAAPVLLHLRSRPRPRVLALASAWLLTSSARSLGRAGHVRRRVLLATRLGVVALLALALAGPSCTSPWVGGPVAPIDLALILDDSASMAAQRGGQSAIAHAAAQLRAALAWAGPGSRVGLWRTGAAAAEAPVGEDVEAVIKALSSPVAGFHGRGASAAISAAHATLLGLPTVDPMRRRVILVGTDLTRPALAAWPRAEGVVLAVTDRAPAQAEPASASVGLALVSPARPGQAATARVSLAGPPPSLRGRQVTVWVDDQPRRVLSAEAADGAQVALGPLDTGPRLLRATLSPPDGFPLDDVSYVPVDVAPAPLALVVTPDGGPPSADAPIWLLAQALSPGSLPEPSRPARLAPVTPAGLAGRLAEQPALVALDGDAPLTGPGAEALAAWAQAGGHVLALPGLNPAVAPWSALVPHWGEVATAEEPTALTLGRLPADALAWASLRDRPELFARGRLRRWARLRSLPTEALEVARLGPDPAVAQWPMGLGQVTTLAFAAGPAYGDLGQAGSAGAWVTIVQAVLQDALSGSRRVATAALGQDVSLPAQAAAQDVVQWHLPGGRILPALMQAGRAQATMAVPGPHWLRSSRGEALGLVVVTPLASEADLVAQDRPAGALSLSGLGEALAQDASWAQRDVSREVALLLLLALAAEGLFARPQAR